MFRVGLHIANGVPIVLIQDNRVINQLHSYQAYLDSIHNVRLNLLALDVSFSLGNLSKDEKKQKIDIFLISIFQALSFGNSLNDNTFSQELSIITKQIGELCFDENIFPSFITQNLMSNPIFVQVTRDFFAGQKRAAEKQRYGNWGGLASGVITGIAGIWLSPYLLVFGVATLVFFSVKSYSNSKRENFVNLNLDMINEFLNNPQNPSFNMHHMYQALNVQAPQRIPVLSVGSSSSHTSSPSNNNGFQPFSGTGHKLSDELESACPSLNSSSASYVPPPVIQGMRNGK